MPDTINAPMQAEVAASLRDIIDDPRIALFSAPGTKEAQAIRQATARIVDRVAPLVAHATNAEPWYQSRVTWGAILSGLTPLLALVGWSLSPESQETAVTALVALVPLLGAGLTLYGRWRARAPIGA